MKNIVENQGIKTDKPLPMSYEALKAERDALEIRLRNALSSEQEAIQRAHAANQTADALAVENAALKDAITTHSQSTHFCELCGKDDPCSTDDVCYALNETPATDAALAAIRKESHIAGIQAAADRIGVISLKYKPGQKQELIKAIGREVFQYATELREAK